MNITVYSADYYRYYYMHLIVSYGNGGNKLFVLFVICNACVLLLSGKLFSDFIYLTITVF